MKDSKKNPTIVLGIIAIACAALGFFGGMKYQQTKSPSFARGGLNNMQGGMQNNSQAKQTGTTKNTNGIGKSFGGMQIGTIASMDETSLTVKLQDGSSKIVILSGTTTYKTMTDASKSDINVGDTIAISGSTNTDGSVSAQSIQLNPAMIGAQQNGNAPVPEK
ncbi:MAG: DUF5666 domain-containing protein [Microgenomates group bacterium]